MGFNLENYKTGVPDGCFFTFDLNEHDAYMKKVFITPFYTTCKIPAFIVTKFTLENQGLEFLCRRVWLI